MKTLMRWMKGLREALGGVRYVPVTGSRRLDEAGLRAAFAGADESPLYRAVMQVLGDNFLEAKTLVTSPKLADRPGELAFAAGELKRIEDTIAALEQWKEMAKVVPVAKS